MKKIIVATVICVVILASYCIYNQYMGYKMAEESLRKYGTSSEQIQKTAENVKKLKEKLYEIGK